MRVTSFLSVVSFSAILLASTSVLALDGPSTDNAPTTPVITEVPTATDPNVVVFTGEGVDAERAAYIKFDKSVRENIEAQVVKAENIQFAKRDLNKDGKEELLVYIEDSFYCGSLGCSFHIYGYDNGEFKSLSPDLVVQKAFSVPGSEHNGYADLVYDMGNGKPVTWAYDTSEGEYRPVDKDFGKEARDPAMQDMGNPTTKTPAEKSSDLDEKF